MEVFEDTLFKLHKLNSNASEIEQNEELVAESEEETYPKQQLNDDFTETAMLVLKWNKSKDTPTVSFPTLDSNATTTKRVIISKPAKVYAPSVRCPQSP